MRIQVSRLDPTRHGSELQKFEARLRQKIVGQDEAIQAVVDLVPGLSSGTERARTPGWESALSRPYRGGKNADGGGHG